ncbi:MAG TPA: SCO family protein [Candidatus Dormibacteraeota bacterium]|nr:SCO family protein [Candidatus Dormibacteraeota bacterium]
MAVVAVAMLWYAPRLSAPTGTLVVVGAGRSATSLNSMTLSVHESGGSWIQVGTVSGSIPAAPEQRQLVQVALRVGNYDEVRVGGAVQRVSLTITSGLVAPLLLGVDAGELATGGVYAGNDDVNLGLGELSGKFVAMPAFSLVNQRGEPIDNTSIAGRDIVIAAFHTTCHETCPLYTALFLQLAKRLPATAGLLEVTTDPGTDTPSTLATYARQVGASWTFGTGTAEQLQSFWKPFDVELSALDAHTSTLVLVDRHGFVRLVYRGVPKVGSDIPGQLTTQLSSRGLYELGSGGDGWGSPDVLQALTTIGGSETTPQTAGGAAAMFRLLASDGTSVNLADYKGEPLVINFWASYCPPCKAEMPLLDQSVGPQSGARLVLVNEGDSSSSTRAFLESVGIHRTALLDSDLTVGHSYGIFMLPMTIFVRADGTIDRRQVGQVDPTVLSAELSNLTAK